MKCYIKVYIEFDKSISEKSNFLVINIFIELSENDNTNYKVVWTQCYQCHHLIYFHLLSFHFIYIVKHSNINSLASCSMFQKGRERWEKYLLENAPKFWNIILVICKRKTFSVEDVLLKKRFLPVNEIGVIERRLHNTH